MGNVPTSAAEEQQQQQPPSPPFSATEPEPPFAPKDVQQLKEVLLGVFLFHTMGVDVYAQSTEETVAANGTLLPPPPDTTVPVWEQAFQYCLQDRNEPHHLAAVDRFVNDQLCGRPDGNIRKFCEKFYSQLYHGGIVRE